MNILSSNLEFAQGIMDFVSIRSAEEKFIAFIKFEVVQRRWVEFWKIHGGIIGNSNWEPNFVELMKSRYNNIEECFE